MDTIPFIMKKTVDEKYFNVPCKGPHCGNNSYYSPCYQCTRKYKYYFTEIASIDNVDVSVVLTIEPQTKNNKVLQCEFQLICESIVCEDYSKSIIRYEDNKLTFEIEDWIHILTQVKYYIDNIRFDKFQSIFTLEPANDYKIVITTFLCGDNQRITKKYDTCCVCFDNTKRRSICCRGFICAHCYFSIKPKTCQECYHNRYNDDCEVDGCGERPCPLCRKSMYSGNVFIEEEFIWHG